jgi:hypothetical protein
MLYATDLNITYCSTTTTDLILWFSRIDGRR